MAKISLALFAVALAFVLFAQLQAAAQSIADPRLDLRTPMLGSSLACSQGQTQIIVPQAAAKRARLKAKLLNLLRDSIYDDAKGVVNVARDREISTLVKKLDKSREP